MNTSPTNSPANPAKIRKPLTVKEPTKRAEGEILLSNRSQASSPISSQSSSSNLSDSSVQELPQIRHISNMQHYLNGRNFESFSGVMHGSSEEDKDML
jgi:hypothetical protein